MNIGIINDVPLAVKAMRCTITRRPEHRVLWVVIDRAQTVEFCTMQPPGMVLMNPVMPRFDGVGATHHTMASSNPYAILVVTSSVGANAWYVYGAMGAGALDAVNTLTLGDGPDADADRPLLTKINQIGRLLEKPVAPRPRVGTPGRNCVMPLMTISASAGGPIAFATVLGKPPAEFGVSIAMIQHVDKAFVAGMAEWLSDQTALMVCVAAGGDRPRAGEVLLTATNDHMHVPPGGTFDYVPESVGAPYRPSVNVFFHSMVEHWQGSTIGMLLTDMDRDDAIDLKAMRAESYHTIAQDAATSMVYGIPKTAAAPDTARVILSLDHIADELITLVRA